MSSSDTPYTARWFNTKMQDIERKLTAWENERRSVIHDRIAALEQVYGGLRPMARALSIDAAYLSRLKSGAKSNPTPKILKKLGLRAADGEAK